MATIPSIALIPSGYKAGKVYSVLPTDGTGDLTFTRASSATRVNSDGLIEEVLSNVPRLNYPLIDGVVQGCPSLLLEPERRNFVLRSQEFDNAAWVKLGQGTGSVPVVTPNYAISPDGTQNASRLQCDLNGGNTTNDRSWLYQSISDLVVGNTFSLYVKNNSSETITFTLNNGSSGTVSVQADSQWHRLYSVKTGGSQPRIGLIGVGGASDTADLLIWGAQVEQGSYATSYIPTQGATATRVAETCNNAGNVNTFNDSEGVLFAEISALVNGDTTKQISLSDGTLNNRIVFGYPSAGGSIYFEIRNAGTAIAFVSVPVSNVVEISKIAVKYKNNDFALWINGIEVAIDNSGILPTGLNRLAFDNGNATGGQFYGNTKQIQYFNTALTDQELALLTSL